MVENKKFSVEQLNRLSKDALTAATLAGQYINQFDKTDLKTNYKDSGSTLSSQVVTEVDLHCQEIIIKALQPSCDKYDIALLSEENCTEIAINQHPRLTKPYFWCVDPLDGTLPFIEGKSGYAVSIALVNQAGVSMLSAIYLPATNETYQLRFDKNSAAQLYKNNLPFKPVLEKNNTVLTLYCDRSFLCCSQYPQLINKLTNMLAKLNLTSLNIISTHGAVVNALMVLENSPACYIKLPKPQKGGGATWDFSGTACLTEAVNGWVTDCLGHPLKLNQADSYYMNEKGVIYASDKTIAEAILNTIN
jgi:3'-phosphoadenosine 5'-phosphosulfate (PAPS) 3'-phosphatase